ncbi:uncharacterized protein LOC118733739 [Rhagoletis pomonella]|uniref:uncharacterized protein LOC118733739 n=1 Tax=Rhagoletis pomonella TaxID=28610 RepID=UPI00177D1DAE|nr:uncharacterized protein LOC118733739 [Rhagoletis pomonella]
MYCYNLKQSLKNLQVLSEDYLFLIVYSTIKVHMCSCMTISCFSFRISKSSKHRNMWPRNFFVLLFGAVLLITIAMTQAQPDEPDVAVVDPTPPTRRPTRPTGRPILPQIDDLRLQLDDLRQQLIILRLQTGEILIRLGDSTTRRPS